MVVMCIHSVHDGAFDVGTCCDSVSYAIHNVVVIVSALYMWLH